MEKFILDLRHQQSSVGVCAITYEVHKDYVLETIQNTMNGNGLVTKYDINKQPPFLMARLKNAKKVIES